MYQRSLREFTTAAVSNRIWIYPDDAVNCKSIDYEDEYGFIHLGKQTSEWMTVRQASNTIRPNEPREDLIGRGTRYISRLNFRGRYSRKRVLEHGRSDQLTMYSIEEIGVYRIKVKASFLPWEALSARPHILPASPTRSISPCY